MLSGVTGQQNTAVGYQALLNNTAGANTATGYQALLSDTTGSANTADGIFALSRKSTGSGNTANGAGALGGNIIGSNNTATGANALSSANTGDDNTAIGFQALSSNTDGVDNTVIGSGSVQNNTTRGSKMAIGFLAGGAVTTGGGNILIRSGGDPSDSNTNRIGLFQIQTRAFISGIAGTAVFGGTPVVTGDGQLGVAVSSKRFKDGIKPMNEASESILALNPVTFHYKQEFDPEGIPQFGLVAEEVEKVNPALITRDANGKPYTVRYDAVNAMLLNEFLKEHRKVEQMKAALAQQPRQIEALAASLTEKTTRIDNAISEIAMHNRATQIVDNQ